MMTFVILKEEDRKMGAKYLKKGLIKELYYSGGTYQSKVADDLTQEELWAFLQLNDQGQITDAFCSCNKAEDYPSCPHIAAAVEKIFNYKQKPLHLRFQQSLWFALGQSFLRSWSNDPLNVQSQEPIIFKQGKESLKIEGKNKEGWSRLKEIFKAKSLETEETSLKFSNLDATEIAHWKEGRPSFELRFELSHWSDLAKWMMQLQEEQEVYKIDFEYDSKSLPVQINIQFPLFSLQYHFKKEELLELVPSFATVNSPLKVDLGVGSHIQMMTWDFEKRGLTLTFQKDSETEPLKEEQSLSLGSWLYFPHKGFASKKKDELLTQSFIEQNAIPTLLDQYSSVIERFFSVHQEEKTLYYQLYFDESDSLCIDSFVNQPQDLIEFPHIRFGKWVYLSSGFYPVRGPFFEGLPLKIPKEKVSDFVTMNRLWLNTQEGFHTHLVTWETPLSYRVEKNGDLVFHSLYENIEGQGKDFGDWIWIESQGFYPKFKYRQDSPVYSGKKVSKTQVCPFIEQYKDELEGIPHFFAPASPVLEISLKIELTAKESIIITPQFKLEVGVKWEDIQFYDTYVYQKGVGFAPLNLQTHCPVEYRRKVTIPKRQVLSFVKVSLPKIRKYASAIDPALEIPKDYFLNISHIEMPRVGQLQIELNWTTELGTLRLQEIFKAKKERLPFLFSSAGLIELSDEAMPWLPFLKEGYFQEDKITMPVWEVLRLHALAPLEPQDHLNASDRDLWQALTAFKPLTNPYLQNLKCTLRPYQEIGVHWLWFLYTFGLSGLLCDEMGLGKTHQTMALMASALHSNREQKIRFLIVCPISVIYHWEDKLKQFLPEVAICCFHGLKRSFEPFEKHGGVLLTSYGVLRSQIEELGQLQFDIAVFDEVQIAKNHQSKTYSALNLVRARMRLGLTGTPIENRVRELKALFDLIMPGYMPSEARFLDLFIHPIEKIGSVEAKERLQRFVKPFILRRKKQEVLQELPEKTEQIAYCEMTERQSELYLETWTKGRATLIEELKDESRPPSYLSFLQLITKLKQICDHPAVALKDTQNYHHYSSGKWQLFLELLNEAQESEQKVVVFSHYLAMMDIMEYYLAGQKIGFAAIRGQTQDRREQLHRFQTDPNCLVFIGSLQAVGLGVDLTAASVVIHYDRWWNAARENQATDRVHRIGQQRGVQVFKLLTKETIEEKIHLLIEEKGKLLEEIVSHDDALSLKKFSRQELLDLLTIPGKD